MFKNLVLVTCLLVLAHTLTGCASHQRIVKRPALISHVVLVTLNDPSQADAAIKDCNAMLRDIPGIVAFSVGKHIDTGRATVDGSYDVGLYIGFNSADAYTGYVEHPQHIALVEKWKPSIKQMRVFDFKDE